MQKQSIRKWILLVIVILSVGWNLFFFVIRRDWQWYERNPVLLLIIALLSLAGGFAALFYYSLNDKIRLGLRITIYGIFSLLYTGILIDFCSFFITSREYLSNITLLLIMLVFSLITLLFWMICIREIKKWRNT